MGTWKSDESGQIIIVAALLIAVLFVGLALVLNSAIYAENMATRGDTSTAEAMSTESVTEEWLGHAVDAENYGTEDAPYSERAARIEANVSTWDGFMGTREATTGRMYRTELTGVTNGTRVNQSTADYFEPANASLLDADPLELGASTNWQSANESEVRAYEMTVRRDSLKQTNGSLANTVEGLLDEALDGTSVFWTQFENGDTHRMYLLNDSDNDSVAAVVTDYEDDTTEEVIGTCSAEAPDPSDNVTVRITRAELEGPNGVTECPALEAVDDGRQDVYYAGVDHAVGTYQFIADKPENEFRADLRDLYEYLLGDITGSDVYDDLPNDEDPYTAKAIYGVTVATTYQDDRITYTRNATYPAAAR